MRRRTPLSLMTRLRHVMGWMIVVALAAVGLVMGGGHFAADELDERIRLHVEELLAGHYRGLTVRLQSARRLPGRGIELRGLSIRAPELPRPQGSLLEIDELMLVCRTSLQDLLAGELDVRHIAVQRLKLQVRRRQDGRWNTAALWPPPKLSKHGLRAGVQIEDAAIEVCCESAGKETLLLSHVDLAIQPDLSRVESAQAPPLHLKGRCRANLFASASIDCRLDPNTRRWNLQGSLQGLKLNDDLQAVMPAELRQRVETLTLQGGEANLRFAASTDVPADAELPLRFAVDGQIRQAGFEFPPLPDPVRNLSATFHADNGGLQIRQLEGRYGPAAVSLRGERHGWTDTSPAHLEATVEGLQLDERLTCLLNPEQLHAWQTFRPEGKVSAQIELGFDGRRWIPKVTVRCQGVDFRYERFPYPLQAGQGTLTYRDEILSLDLWAPLGERQLSVRGELIRPGSADGEGWVEVETDGPVPLDDELIAALDSKPEQVVRSLGVRGFIKVWGRVERDGSGAAPRKRFEITLDRCAMKFDKFPYPIEDIRGTVSVRDEVCRFDSLVGRNESAVIRCSGSWDPNDAEHLHLRLRLDCSDVPLDDELHQALNDGARQIWSRLRPRGTLDRLAADVNYSATQRRLSLAVRAEKSAAKASLPGRSLSLEPSFFPYRLEQVTGAVSFVDGVVTLEKVRARHGDAKFAFEGVSEGRDGNWQLNFRRFTATQLAVDRDLITALPRRLGYSLAKLNLTGPLSIQGAMALEGGRQSEDFRGQWDVVVDVENGSLGSGVRLSNVRGGVRLYGRHGPEGLACRGDVAIDSLMVHGVQVTQIQGPLWLDDRRLVLGSWSQAGSATQPARQLTAKVVGGGLMGDLHFDLTDEALFAVQCSLANAELAQLARACGRNDAPVAGKTFLTLDLRGSRRSTHTWRGFGAVRLREADIYKLPVMVALLKLLYVREPDTTAFTQSDVDFRVEGDRVYLDRIHLDGDAVSLRGNGEMNLQRQINVNFYALVGREEVTFALLRPLFKEASRNVLLIQVTGTLDHPNVTRRPFPELNDTLQQIFPEVAQSSAGRGRPAPPPPRRP